MLSRRGPMLPMWNQQRMLPCVSMSTARHVTSATQPPIQSSSDVNIERGWPPVADVSAYRVHWAGAQPCNTDVGID